MRPGRAGAWRRGLIPGALVALAVVTAAGPARAGEAPASFSCERPGRPDEQIICGDPLLRAADAGLGRQFDALLAGTGAAVRREAIRSDEHDWILRRNRECGVLATSRVNPVDRPSYVDCFLAAYDERTDDLDRIRRSPGTDPASISTPIRRSLFADAAPAEAGLAEPAIDTAIASADGEHPVFAWRPDGSLLVVGRDAARGVLGLYRWADGTGAALLSDSIADTDRIERICLAADDVVLVPKPAVEVQPLQLLAGGSVRLVSRTAVPGPLATACGLSYHRRLVVGEPDRVALDLGPIDRPATDLADRFVQMRRDDATGPTRPAIRIDRRVALRADYLAWSRDFVVSAGRRPARGEAAVERVWAKTNCVVFWRVAVADGAVAADCIPYGSYVGSVPQPLPTKAGLFFAAGEAGLFRVGGTSTRRVLVGPIASASVAPDGCHIALARGLAPAHRPKPGRVVAVFDACAPG